MKLLLKASRVGAAMGVSVLLCAAAHADWLSIAAALKKCPPPATNVLTVRDIVVGHPNFTRPKTAVIIAPKETSAKSYVFPAVVPPLEPAGPAPKAKKATKPKRKPQGSSNNQTPTKTQSPPKNQPPAKPQPQSQSPSQPPTQTQITPIVPNTTTPAPPPQPIIQPQVSANGQKLVSNVFAGTDIREAFSEIASTAGVTIIPDDTIKNTLVYMEFRNEPIDSAIEKLALLSGAYVKEQSPGVYLVSQATPDAGLFRMFAENETFFTQNTSAAVIQSMLPTTYKPYVQFDVKSNRVSVMAPAELMPHILADIHNMDKPPRQFRSGSACHRTGQHEQP